MGQTDIRSVLDISMHPSLRKTLEAQLQEYDIIESEAHRIASQRGWEFQDLDPAIKILSDAMTRVRLSRGNCESKIADMMIHRNTKMMVKCLKYLHRVPNPDEQISMISQKLLDCETVNIRQMQRFL